MLRSVTWSVLFPSFRPRVDGRTAILSAAALGSEARSAIRPPGNSRPVIVPPTPCQSKSSTSSTVFVKPDFVPSYSAKSNV